MLKAHINPTLFFYSVISQNVFEMTEQKVITVRMSEVIG